MTAGIAPALRTNRLTLRMPAVADSDDSAAMWANPAVVRFIGGRPFTPEEVWNRLLRYAGLWSLLGFGYWTMRETATDRFVGEIGFADFRRAITPPLGDAPECGWVLAAAAQGRGLAGEALATVLAWGDAHLCVPRSVALIHPDNTASIRLAGRHGFRPFATGDHHGAPVTLFERTTPEAP